MSAQSITPSRRGSGIPGASSGPNRRCRIEIGTSGYSYTEWVDCGFYPPGTKAAEMLPLYGRQFSVVELNYTWYQMVRAEAVARMMALVPENFRFAAKLTRTLTHEPGDDWQRQLALFRTGIAPLGKRLAAILIQLPPDFDRTLNHRRYLAQLLDGLYDQPVAVEFRHASWAVDSVFQELERRMVTLVTVDAPELAGLFPLLDVVTNPDLFYVRFHGRNSAGWRSSNMQKKFDYDYSHQELQHWYENQLTRLSTGAAAGLLFFNNHVRAQAPRNGRTLMQLLV